MHVGQLKKGTGNIKLVEPTLWSLPSREQSKINNTCCSSVFKNKTIPFFRFFFRVNIDFIITVFFRGTFYWLCICVSIWDFYALFSFTRGGAGVEEKSIMHNQSSTGFPAFIDGGETVCNLHLQINFRQVHAREEQHSADSSATPDMSTSATLGKSNSQSQQAPIDWNRQSLLPFTIHFNHFSGYRRASHKHFRIAPRY